MGGVSETLNFLGTNHCSCLTSSTEARLPCYLKALRRQSRPILFIDGFRWKLKVTVISSPTYMQLWGVLRLAHGIEELQATVLSKLAIGNQQQKPHKMDLKKHP